MEGAGAAPRAPDRRRDAAGDAEGASRQHRPQQRERAALPRIHPDHRCRPSGLGIPDLSTKEGVEAIEEHITDGVDLVILDNLSTLCRGGKENESESWVPIQEWILSLRWRGISVIFVHHAGKGGAQRGTSKREDVLDTVVVLRHPDDYSPFDGARFEVHLDKARGVYGDQAQPFEAQLTIVDDVMTWTMRDLGNVEVRRAADLKEEGFSVRDIAGELGISKSRVDRLLKKSDEAGARHKMNGNPK
jgi:putative DNA primase/helicase